MNDQRFSGVWPTMVTPFTPGGAIDYDGVAALVDWYLAQGVDGIFALCQSSEMFFLTPEEGAALVRFIVRRVAGRVPVVASGHVAETIAAQADGVRRIAAEGPDAVVLITNRFAAEGEGDDAWMRRFDELVGQLPQGIALGMYECPYPHPRLATIAQVRRLVADGRFVFFKDTCCAYDPVVARVAAAHGSRLSVLNANAALLLPTLRAGVDGYCGVMANFHPRLYAYLIAHAHDEDADGTVQRLADFLAVSSAIEARQYPVCAKYYLSLCGLPIGTYARSKDAAGLTESFRAELMGLRRMSLAWEDEIGGGATGA